MKIMFKKQQLVELLENGDGLQKKYGRLAKPVIKLIDKIKKLIRKELYSFPGFHELKEQAKGIYAVRFKHPYRFVMMVDSYCMLILDIVDYHGKKIFINHFNSI